MNYQNRNAFQSLSNNQNPNNQAMNNQSLSSQNFSNQSATNQGLSNQAQLQNESSLAALGYNAQQDLEMAAELNQKTQGEVSRILASQSMTGIEFGYLPNAAQMNNMNNQNNFNNANNLNNNMR